jgi:hypothetical protein
MEIFPTYGSGLFAPKQNPQIYGQEVRAKALDHMKQDPVQVNSTFADPSLDEKSLFRPVRDRGAVFDALM